MPTYEYTCTACGARSEVVQKFTDDPLTECDACGGRLRKVFSAVGIVFKGPGFYRTDSRAAVKEPVAAGKQVNGSEAAKAGDSASAKDSSKGSATSADTSPKNGTSTAGPASGAKSSSAKVA